ncbi:hypothetical protein [Halomonas sp. KO116]|uniref:hypothetical protein n=1 Tax=Halomonas sp. KO116 TaxID=1504981 RepID=UPI000B257956|nr:hypothetical protein [Halomonas sp. KO116]
MVVNQEQSRKIILPTPVTLAIPVVSSENLTAEKAAENKSIIVANAKEKFTAE